MAEVRNLDVSSFRNVIWMDATSLEELLQLVAPLITHQENHMKSNISPNERFALTLRYLACFVVASSSRDWMRIGFTITYCNFNNLCGVELAV